MTEGQSGGLKTGTVVKLGLCACKMDTRKAELCFAPVCVGFTVYYTSYRQGNSAEGIEFDIVAEKDVEAFAYPESK